MNAPFKPDSIQCSLPDLSDPGEVQRLERFVAEHPAGTVFHRPAWLLATAKGTGNRAIALIAERSGAIVGYLPLTEAHSPVFGRLLASSGFGVGGGIIAESDAVARLLLECVEELAERKSCSAVELRGGEIPQRRLGWRVRSDTHSGFVAELAADDEAQLTWIPRKQRAEVRKGLASPLLVTVGTAERDRTAHFAVYCESVRNLGTPVFPRSLFDAVLDAFGADADILTVWDADKPVSSVLSLYHKGAVMPYWGGGTRDARRLRANDRMYYDLMLHARNKGCSRFDFGRSKTGSGPYDFKRNWGFEPEPLHYAAYTAPGHEPRDADPTSGSNSAKIALWKRLPLPVANLIGPHIARGLA